MSFSPSERDAQIIGRVWNAHTLLAQAYETFTREQLSNFASASGHIYSQKQLDKLDREFRPNFQYNLFRPILNQIAGAFKRSTPGIALLPQEPHDEQASELFEILNNVVSYQQNDLRYELAKSYLDALIGRIGWVRQDWIVNDAHPKGYVRIQHADPFSIRADVNLKNRSLEDCNYIEDSRWLSPEKICEIYAADNPELAEQIMEDAAGIIGRSTDDRARIRTWGERVQQLTNYAASEKRGYDAEANSQALSRQYLLWKDGLLETIDFYERRQCHSMFALKSTGTEIDLTDLIIKDGVGASDMSVGRSEWYDNQKLQYVREQYPDVELRQRLISKIYQSTVCPVLNCVLYDKLQDIQSGFKLTPIMCFDWSPDLLETRSVVDDMKDQTRSYTERRNTILTMLMTYAQGGWIAEEQAIKDYEEEWKSNKIGLVRHVKKGQIGNVKQIEPPTFPTGLDLYAKEDLQAVKDITGSTDPARGQTSNAGDSGKLFDSQVEQSNLMQEWHAENAQQTLVPITRNTIAMIQKYYTNYEFIRVDNALLQNAIQSQKLGLPEGEYSWLEINKPTPQGILNDVGRQMGFDIQFSPVPFGDQAKQTQYNTLLSLNMMLAKLNPALVDIEGLVKNAPITMGKESLIEHVTKILKAAEAAQQAQEAAAAAAAGGVPGAGVGGPPQLQAQAQAQDAGAQGNPLTAILQGLLRPGQAGHPQDGPAAVSPDGQVVDGGGSGQQGPMSISDLQTMPQAQMQSQEYS